MHIRVKACDNKCSKHVMLLLEQVRFHCEGNMVRSVLEKWDGTDLTYLTFLKMTRGTVLLEFYSKIAITHFLLNRAHYPHS